MTETPFCKFHGFGNDYIVLEKEHAGPELPDLARAICHRNTGVGADGIAVLERLDGTAADYGCQIVNPDGSYASFSGNGTRCAVSYLYHRDIWTKDTVRLRTRSGIKVYKLLDRKDGKFIFEAEIGSPKFASDEVPVLTDDYREYVINEPFDVFGRPVFVSAVNVGNPVACVFVDDFLHDWRAVGNVLESHERFPERTNVVFINVSGRDSVDVRIWERGAGETSSSGTCSTAAAVMSAFLLKTDRTVKVRAPGGVTTIVWREDEEVLITGQAELVFCGAWPV
jgi:diaminopimelate epimerase